MVVSDNSDNCLYIAIYCCFFKKFGFLVREEIQGQCDHVAQVMNLFTCKSYCFEFALPLANRQRLVKRNSS